jgi:hypothetical protein
VQKSNTHSTHVHSYAAVLYLSLTNVF